MGIKVKVTAEQQDLAPFDSNGTVARSAGVSVVICCHNSAKRLLPTLLHLAAQEDSDVEWEIVLVNNASTDETVGLTRRTWPSGHRAALRIIQEEKIGLSYARVKGLAAARYDLISFIDDDNWVSRDWIKTVSDIFRDHPEIGACIGINQPSVEIDPPEWFDKLKRAFAVGDFGPASAYYSYSEIWGAGLCIRMRAWEQLLRAGFAPNLVGRSGGRLSSGEDTEICAALVLAGWKLFYEPRLKLKHFIPAGRLTWRYALNLYRGFGSADVALKWYHFALSPSPSGFLARARRTWIWNVLSAVRSLIRHRKGFFLVTEGRLERLGWEHSVGRFEALMLERGTYARNARRVQLLHRALAGGCIETKKQRVI